MIRKLEPGALNLGPERQVEMSPKPSLLRIDASARVQGSHSRAVADAYQAAWAALHPGGSVVVRDLVQTPVPHIHRDTILGFYTPPQELGDRLKAATALSDTLIGELRAADTLLLSTPMYNFSVPSVLKAWIDQVVRAGHTFAYTEEKGLHGLIEHKNAVVVTSAGAAYYGTALQHLDFLNPYLQALLAFLGFDEVEFISVEGATTDEKILARTREAALRRAAHLQAA